MNNQRKARVTKVVDGTTFHLQDCQSNNQLIVQLSPPPPKPNIYPILQAISDREITYELAKKTSKIKEQMPKAILYLEGKNISELYVQNEIIPQCTDEKKYEKDQIIQCYIMGIQCLKMKLYLLEHNQFLTFYFSELKLPKIQHSHPKDVWMKAEEYFRGEFLGDFVQIKINGSESYRQQTNIYGEILRLHNGLNIKQKCLRDGYAELSKNSQKYLTPHQITNLLDIISQSKKNKRGIWGIQQKITKGSNQIMQQKYLQWQQYLKKKTKYNQIKNVENEIKQLINQLKKNNNIKSDPNKCRIILQTIMSIFQECTSQKNIGLLEEFVKNVILCITNIQTSINCNTQNYDFLRYLNKLFILVLFYVLECQKLGNKNKNISAELEKIIKVVFKCSFIGNQIFHQRVFDRRKQSDFDTFQFDQASLSGISSYSQASDMQDKDRQTKQNKTQKKIASAQSKIRINSTLLISTIFKNYPNIVENHWQICVKSNILTKQFMDYLQKLKIAVQPTKMTSEQKKYIASLMRTNFGDYSLVLLIFFQQNAKVKMNALNCMIHMIGNFQSRKIIDTTEAVYVEKLLNQTKSSFVPKSFIVFSGLRNALYFMLFSLYHERNILIIMNTFTALTQLCQQSTLIDKMGFIQGMGLLMANYICPVLKFPWQGKQLIELKCLCVSFLGALVNTQKKWDEMQNLYLMSQGDKNINSYLVSTLKECKQQNKDQHQKIITQICKYFKNMTKRYLPAIFFEIYPGISVWSSMANYFLKYPHPIYPTFVQQIFKCHFDQISQMKTQVNSPRRVIEAVNKAQSLFGPFLSEFFPIYSKNITNQNYVGLLSILTYVPYNKWGDNSYKTAKQFLDHCFDSISGEKLPHKIYPSFAKLQDNSLIRLGLIKLLGYISFCKQFQNPDYSTLAIKSLLQYSRAYKSPNSVVKITWGISNWSNIDCFKQGLSQNQLKQCLDYMIRLSQSDKQKIASNCTRGIGFFLTKFNKDVNIQECRLAIVKNLSHPIIKVRINSTKTLRMMVKNQLIKVQYNSASIQQLIGILEQNILKNNYHLQIETLLLIKDLGNPIKQKHMMKIYSHILHDLLSHTTMEYQFSEIRALKQLRKVVLEEMVKYPEYLLEGTQTAKQFYQTVENFIIDSQQQSIRKQAQNSKILQRGFEKGEQALNAVFNIVKQKYDEQKTITTSFTARGVQYEAEQADLQLLGKIKSTGKQLYEKDAEHEKQKWKFLADMQIQHRKIYLGKLAENV